jgi:hypothetical protein
MVARWCGMQWCYRPTACYIASRITTKQPTPSSKLAGKWQGSSSISIILNLFGLACSFALRYVGSYETHEIDWWTLVLDCWTLVVDF